MVEIKDDNTQEHPYWRKDAMGQTLLDTEGSPLSTTEIRYGLDALASVIGKHMEAQGFWDDEDAVMRALGCAPGTEGAIDSLKAIALRWKNAEKYMLIITELAECIEGDRAGDNSPSDKIPGFTQLEEEISDIIVRALDFAHRRKLRIGEAFVAKMNVNASRPFRHGKKF